MMMSKTFYQLRQNFPLIRRAFATTQDLAKSHEKKHLGTMFDPKFYINDIFATQAQEVEFIRSPFYDLAKIEQMDSDKAQNLLDELSIKMQALEGMTGVLKKPPPTKESVAYTRYADENADDNVKHLYQFPRGRPYRRIDPTELFKVQKPENHWEYVKRSKSYIGDQFFGPFDLKEGNLKTLLIDQKQAFQDLESEEFQQWRDQLLQLIPKLNHDILVNLSLHLAYDAQLNDRKIWQTIEQSILDVFHHLPLLQICQLEWATMELKPKQTTPRFNTMLTAHALSVIDKASVEDLICIMQGFRKRGNKDMFIRIRQTLMDRKQTLFPQDNKKQDQRQRAEQLVNLFYSYASDKPKQFGLYKEYHKDDINELLAHYEEDLIESTQHIDVDHLTRLAQSLYLLRSTQYENILWRVEDQINEKIDKLDTYHITNILRSFTHSQENKMNGKDKTFYNMEPKIIKNIDQINDRDLTHLMYAYSVRKVGNPELHKAFEKRLGQIADRLDYPSLFNAIYYMLFRENANEEIWQKIVTNTASQEDTLPLIYYKPFKASKFFLKHHFPKMDIIDYTDKFWYAEKYFNILKHESYLEQEQEYYNFKSFLNAKILVYPTPFLSVHNLFMIHYAFNEQKIGINYHLNKFTMPNRTDPSEIQKLPTKIMKLEGWEILDITEKEFKNWTYDERITNIKGWFKEAKERQVKKGIMPAKPIEYV